MTATSMYTPVRMAVVLVAAGAVLLSGCGSDDGSDPGAAAAPAATTAAPGSAEPSAATSEDTTSPVPDTTGSAGAATEEAPEPTTEEAAEEIVITIVDFAYELPDTVPPGSTVTVVNEDAAAHTVTSAPAGEFGLSLTGGQSATFTAPEEPGEYTIICLFHGNMTATLVVG